MVQCHVEIFPAAAEKHFPSYETSAVIIRFIFFLSLKIKERRIQQLYREKSLKQEVESSVSLHTLATTLDCTYIHFWVKRSSWPLSGVCGLCVRNIYCKSRDYIHWQHFYSKESAVFLYNTNVVRRRSLCRHSKHRTFGTEITRFWTCKLQDAEHITVLECTDKWCSPANTGVRSKKSWSLKLEDLLGLV